MKRYHWYVLVAFLLASCQPQIATQQVISVPPTRAAALATSITAAASQSTETPAASNAAQQPTQPVIHSSSLDPNAPNLIVVRDQSIASKSVTVDSVTAAQAGWLVIYLEKKAQPGHPIGFVAVPSGKSQQVVVPLNPSPGVEVSASKLAGQMLFVVLQAGTKAPGTPVQVQGRSVLQTFTVLSGSKP